MERIDVLVEGVDYRVLALTPREDGSRVVNVLTAGRLFHTYRSTHTRIDKLTIEADLQIRKQLQRQTR